MNKKKAFVLFSGGLDSMLAVRVLENQGFLVTGVCFESNFYNADKAKEVAKQIGIELMTIDISQEILGLVKNPPHGLGKNMNPCIDCHGLMIRKVEELVSATPGEGVVIATGEVLGQRPFSQNKQALEKVKNISGADVLRPLSAQLLPETEHEKNGHVDRKQLFNLQGRQRAGQKELLKKFKIKKYPSPAGGCLLTDPAFSARLKKMVEYWPDCQPDDVSPLKYGRVYWASVEGKMVLVVIGRHKEDNEMLEKLAKKGDFMVKLRDGKGPNSLVRGILKQQSAELEAKIPIENNFDLELEKNLTQEEFVDLVLKMTGYFAPKLRDQKAYFDVKTIK